MTITVTAESEIYNTIPRHFLKRYVRVNREGHFYWCEVDSRSRNFDVRQGRCDENDLPVAVVEAARKLVGFWPSYVDWPL